MQRQCVPRKRWYTTKIRPTIRRDNPEVLSMFLLDLYFSDICFLIHWATLSCFVVYPAAASDSTALQCDLLLLLL
jgi:hypothetical protein